MPQIGRQECPKCNAKIAKATTVTERFVYLRCNDCGAVWVIQTARVPPR